MVHEKRNKSQEIISCIGNNHYNYSIQNTKFFQTLLVKRTLIETSMWKILLITL